jgi:hypothetical protein
MSAKSGTTAFLSQLDAYICELFDRYFIYIYQRHATVRFEYDYHRLKRWLLKMSFNSARVHGSMDLFVYADLLRYIRGESLSAGRSVQLYVQLSCPGEIPREHLRDPELIGAPIVWEPKESGGTGRLQCRGRGTQGFARRAPPQLFLLPSVLRSE